MAKNNRDMSDIKLIITDLDGTLLNSNSEVSRDFFQIFNQLRKKNILFAAASGRQYYSIIKKLDSIKDEIIVIAENGGYVRYRDEEWLVCPLTPEISRELVLKVRPINRAFPILCGRKAAYIEDNDEEFIASSKEYFGRLILVDSLLDIKEDDVLKFSVCDLDDAAQNSYPHFRVYEDQMEVKVSGKIWLDITPKHVNKGHALSIIQKKYGITPAQTMAFGDYMNDTEMLQQSYYSFAMANAQPDIKKTARFSAKSNDEDGVTEILKELIREN